MTLLKEAYSGELAKVYDARRTKSLRWKNEIAAMSAMLPKTGATRVLDCPFGTGRWVPQYLKAGLSVIGVDLSVGMLAEAQAKIDLLDTAQQAEFELHEGSIFALNSSQNETAPDLITCIRFLNWISFSDVEKVIALLTSYNTQQMIVGLTVVPLKASKLRRWWSLKSLQRINGNPDRPCQYIHQEADFLTALAQHGWQVEEQSQTKSRYISVNYFYRLKRVAVLQ